MKISETVLAKMRFCSDLVWIDAASNPAAEIDIRLTELSLEVTDIDLQLETTEKKDAEGDSSYSTQWCRLQQSRAELLLEREKLLEELRLDKLAADFEEKYPGIMEEGNCPLCFDVDAPSMTHFTCCGQSICEQCCDRACFETCPFCRHIQPKTQDEYVELIRQRAKEGRSWAHTKISLICDEEEDGTTTFPLLRIAAEKDDALAEYLLASAYDRGAGVERSVDDALIYSMRAATKGRRDAAHLYASLLSDDTEKIKWLTLSAMKNRESAQYDLARAYAAGDYGLVQSDERAFYWLDKSANAGEVRAQSLLGLMIANAAVKRYGASGYDDHDAMAQSLYWLQKAAGQGCRSSIDMIKRLSWMRKECWGCGKRPDGYEVKKLIECRRCRVATYCSLKCLATDWKSRHNNDCIPYATQDIRFEKSF